MDYKKTLEWLYSQLPMYQRQGSTAFKKDLKNITRICEINNNVHTKFKTIHVGGTNGKGSVSHMIASILQAAGYKTGLYTSPHLKDFRERIKINGQMISKKEVRDFVKKCMPDFQVIKPSFFEMTVAAAFDHFAGHNVDVALVEVGLGGRLDSTNIINPLLSVITNISKDHTRMLGDSVKQIAFEKAGIIKEKTPVLLGESNPAYDHVFEKKAAEQNATLYKADKEYTADLIHADSRFITMQIALFGTVIYKKLQCDLLGNYQIKNVITSLKAIELLQEHFITDKQHIFEGMSNVKKNTGFAGRWQILGNDPLIIADTGHNEAGIKELMHQIERIQHKTLHFVLGMVKDKDIDRILKLLPKKAVYYYTKAEIPRALNENTLQDKANRFGLKGKTYEKAQTALEQAKRNAAANDIIFIGGSTFTVAELI